MRATLFLTVLLAPFNILAAPAPLENAMIISERQAPVKPKPCEPIVPAPTEEETKVRFDKFANEFLVKKNITAAFEFISQGYIVCQVTLS